jgi:hypothetical protein
MKSCCKVLKSFYVKMIIRRKDMHFLEAFLEKK